MVMPLISSMTNLLWRKQQELVQEELRDAFDILNNLATLNSY